MKILSYAFTVLSVACATMASNCNRDLECLTTNAQITFIGRVVAKDDTNTKYFSAQVEPLCTMFGNTGSTINQSEYGRPITIGGFGSHAGGTCQAEIGNVGETDIFFVHVNNTVAAGGIRTFGLYDPCYGAFPNDTTNYIQLTKFIHSKYNYAPNGIQCPVVNSDDQHIYIDGNSYDKTVEVNLGGDGNGGSSIDLESGFNSGSPKGAIMTTSALIVLAFLFQFLL